MGKVYGYCRTARAGNINEQMELVSNYCKENGLELAVCYCDDGVSAHSAYKDGLDKLLEVIEKGDTIVTKDYSRFMRNPIKQQVFVNDLNSKGIEIIYVDAKEEDNMTDIKSWIEERWGKKTRDE